MKYNIPSLLYPTKNDTYKKKIEQVQKPINAKIRSESLTERISWKTGRTQRIEHITRICNI